MTKDAAKEIVFELAPEAAQLDLSKSENNCNPLKLEEIHLEKLISDPPLIKDTNYESPKKSNKNDEDWNFKLPSIKSSSGHENFRNSQSDQILEGNKENVNNSMSVEMLEKSPDVTVFHSERDFSPRDPL